MYSSNMSEYIEKAKILVEALPYIEEFKGITVVIKYGGSALVNEDIKNTIMQDIALMKYVGFRPVVVHGGGPDINKMLSKVGKESVFVDGLRVTDEETMEIAEMVLSGKVGKAIVSEIEAQGIKSCGISGKDGRTLKVSKLTPNGKDIGFVGEVCHVDTTLIKTLIDNDFVPVISSIGFDENGDTYNINADYAAVAVAGALAAEKLVFLTDVEGVLTDVKDSNSLITRINTEEILKLINSGIISGGMIPKVQCCLSGVEAGVKHVHILDGRVEHCLILEIFTKDGIGTLIEK